MRPRSRLPSKGNLLLPTITEGTEETVRDLNEANTLHITSHGQSVSSEDYFLSICHLAHPTFPTRDVSPDNLHTRQLDALYQRPRLSRLDGTTSTTFGNYPTGEAHSIVQEEEKQVNDKLMSGNCDPLEYLYGHHNNISGGTRRVFVEGKFTTQHRSMWEGRARTRAHSIPHASSCSGFHTSTNTLVPNSSPKHSLARLEANADRGTEGERQDPTFKQSLISQWISDCRSTWREARVRACMLPAIAEI